MKVRKLLFIGFILALTAAACGGGGVDEEEPSATTEAVATATDTLAVDSPTPRPAENIPSSTGTSFSYCLLDAEEVDDRVLAEKIPHLLFVDVGLTLARATVRGHD